MKSSPETCEPYLIDEEKQVQSQVAIRARIQTQACLTWRFVIFPYHMVSLQA